MSPAELQDVRLLAVDLGLRCGWAAFGPAGRLLGYGSRHFGTLTSLRKAVPQILGAYPRLRTLVVEGGGRLLAPWEREAARRGLGFRALHGEEWRRTMLRPFERRSGAEAKAAADVAARELIARSGAKRPTSLRHDAAEAVLLGAWAVGFPDRTGAGGA